MSAKPNFLVLMADQMAAAALPFLGASPVIAPRMQALADKGVTFTSAYCPSPLCGPSRFALMAGQLPSRIGAYDNACEFAAQTPTLAHYACWRLSQLCWRARCISWAGSAPWLQRSG
jgi:choline-sulfatase